MALGKFLFPTIYRTSQICLGPTVTKIKVRVYYSGDIVFYVTADGGTNWETISLTSGVLKTHTFTTSGTNVQFMAVGVNNATISTQMGTSNQYNTEAIRIEIVEHT